MVNQVKQDALKTLRSDLETLSTPELKKKASAQFGIKFTRDDDKDSIINSIIGQAQKFDFAKTPDGGIKPGWTRIKVHPKPGYPNTPFFVGLNDIGLHVPVKVEVDIPTKFVALLNDAVEHHAVQDESGESTTWEKELSYAFSIIGSTPGPDPRPGFEVSREAKLKPYRAFVADMVRVHGGKGWWPSKDELIEWRKTKTQEDIENLLK